MLILAATPIGNLKDASVRLIELLESATVVAAEDTRVTQRLLRGLDIQNRPRFVAVHEHNERERAASLVEQARDSDVVLVSDAGMPTVSDPGYAVVLAAIEAGVEVSIVPGPSAVTTALAVSGLPTDRFVFEGFLPRRSGERRRAAEALVTEQRTLVFFESPNRLAESLADLADVFGADRPAAVARELTKLYEEVRRGGLAELAAWAAEGVRGEIVLVVGGATAVEVPLEDGVAQVLALVERGARLKEASTEVAEGTGLSRRALYEAALAARVR